MKKTIFAFLLVSFAMTFLICIFRLSFKIQNNRKNIQERSDVLVIDKKIKSQYLITQEEISPQRWTLGKTFKQDDWKDIALPETSLLGESEFRAGNFIYYRIKIPKAAFQELEIGKESTSFSPGYVNFQSFEIYINGNYLGVTKPESENGRLKILPVIPRKDNLLTIRSQISKGDSGIYHRARMLLGSTQVLNELYLDSYKSSFVFPLIFILCKSSVVFIFTLIYLLMSVEKFFETSLLFSLCAIGEDLLVGDFLKEILNVNERVMLYNILNLGASFFLFKFLSQVSHLKFQKKCIVIGTCVLWIVSFIGVYDLLRGGLFMSFPIYLSFWNGVYGIILIFFLPKFFRTDKFLLLMSLLALSFVLWNLFYGSDPGFNYRMYGNLIIFFIVAYQSFALFRAEQLDREAKRIQLIEQERDVVVGKAAALLAHDVRRPLEQLRFILEKIEQGKANAEFISVAKNDVASSLSTVNEQISSILDTQTPKKALVEEVSFYKVLNSSVKQIATINPDVSIQFESDLRANRKVVAEESRLAGILSNLLANGFEAIRDIGGRSSGKIFLVSEIRDNSFMFSIENDGPKIPEEIIERIWEPRFTSGKPKGTGLGLESVRKSVESLSGRISVKNTTRGVLFELFLPLGKTNDEPVLVIPQSTPRPEPKEASFATDVNRPFRLFLLDDDAQVKDYIEFLCKNLPFNVEMTHHTHYSSAREDVLSRRFDLYLLDYDLGSGRTGVDLYNDCLSHLGKEVVIHTSRKLEGLSGAGFRIKQKPITGEELAYLLEHVYQKRKRILFVDDGELYRMAWEMFHGSHNITCLKTPEEGIEYLRSNNGMFDVLVTDHYFENSQLSGIDILSEAQKLGLPSFLASSVLSDIDCVQISKNDFDIRKYGF